MKENVKILPSGEKFNAKDILMGVMLHFFVFVCGFLSANGVVADKLLPFGISIVAGCSFTYTPACAMGVFFGYLITPIKDAAFKHIVAMFAVLAIKLLLSGYRKLISSEVFLCFVSLISSGFTFVAAYKILGGSLILSIGEAVLVAVGTFFACRGFKGLAKCETGLSLDELSSLLIVINILLLGLMDVGFNGVSVGRILSALLILIAAKHGGIIAGAISGVTVAFTMALSGVSGNIGIAYAVSGLFCAVFATLGKYAQIFVIVVLSFIGAISTEDLSVIYICFAETFLGALIFSLLPRGLGIYFGKVFSAQPKISAPMGMQKAVTMRLELASKALKDVSHTVEQVSTALAKINTPDFNSVISHIEQDACAGCKLRIHCWEKKQKETVEAILQIIRAIKKGDTAPESAVDGEFKERCIKIKNMCEAVDKRYDEYSAQLAAEKRIEEVRSVVSDQFDGISSMLSEMATDFEKGERFDNSAAENAAAALKNVNIQVEECSSRVDKYGRMTLEFKIQKTPELVINKAQVLMLCSLACERDFDVPTVSKVDTDIYITLNERTKITVDFGASQLSANDNSMCGDAYKYFTDSKGHFVMILSDGMGTGGRAAVDGAMASELMSRLLKAGFGYDCSLKILNSSMLFKSTDESLATVDVVSVDLYTGKTELYKAGAAPTVLRQQGQPTVAEGSSLPAGILRDISFDKSAVRLRLGDIVVLVSDGATGEGTEWIMAEIADWQDGSAQDLAEHLCQCAKRRQNENRQDDITVMCGILNKAV
jgi:stage II sporulation protein E